MRSEQGLVHRTEERSQRGYVLDPPTVKRLEHVFMENESIPTGTSGRTCIGIPCACPASGNMYAGFYCPGIIDQREARQQKGGSY